jgi:hypothetical protein
MCTIIPSYIICIYIIAIYICILDVPTRPFVFVRLSFLYDICIYYLLVLTGMSFLDADSSLNDKKNAPKTTVTSFARLQRQSPMTATIASNRYRSNHRVLGNIVNALINLQKYTVSIRDRIINTT